MSQAGIINIAGGGGGGSPIETITGNTGGPEAPIANNFNFLTANSTVIFAGSPGTETLDFGLSNLIIGSKPTPTNTNNVGLGQNALASLMSAGECTCIGAAAGRLLTTANNCTLIGDGAGSNITTSFQNTSLGADTLSSLTTGSGSNTALGFEVLSHLLTGTRNIGIGLSACDNYVGAESSNIVIGNAGVASESNVIRIGTQGSGAGQQNIAFMAGITGVTAVGSPTAVSSTGQLSDLGFGTSTQVLTSNGPGVSPTWQPAGGGGSFNGFLAFLSANALNVTGDSLTNYHVAFDSTSYNTASNYNTGTFTYTAPTTGTYIFGGVIYGFGYGAGHTEQNIQIITTATTFNMYTVNPFLMAGNDTLVVPFSQQCHMTAGDTAFINLFVGTSTNTVGVGGLLGLSSFWGQFLG